MWKIYILALLAAITSSALAEKPAVTQMFTVAQLEQFLASSHGVKDKALPRHIYNLRLTERLSNVNFARLESDLPGPKSRDALTAIADESAFIKLPTAEIPSKPVPSPEEQSAMLARTMDYLARTVHMLPDLYATRTTTAYVGTVTAIPHGAYDAIFGFWDLHNDQRLTVGMKTSATVLYRDGQDSYADEKERVKNECGYSGPAAISTGQFGHILALLPKIIAKGSLIWDHWEQDSSEFLVS